MSKQFEIRKSPVHCNGCFATEDIPTGTVWEFELGTTNCPVHGRRTGRWKFFNSDTENPHLQRGEGNTLVVIRDIKKGEEIFSNYSWGYGKYECNCGEKPYTPDFSPFTPPED